MANVGVTFDFAAESAKLRAEVDKVRKEMSKLTETAQTIEKGFKFVGSAIVGAFSISAIGGFLRTVNDAADRLNDLSGQLGTSAIGLQSLQIAAQQAGGSAEGMNTALARMSQTLGDALSGNKQAAAAFDRLGLSARDLASMKADQAFLAIDDAVGKLGNSFERAATMQDIYGKGWRDIAGLSGEAREEVARVNAELERQGALLSNLDVATIGVMNDELALQGQIVQNLGMKFLSGLAPAVGVAIDSVANLMGVFGGATSAGQDFGILMARVFMAIQAGAWSVIAVFETLRSAIFGVLSGAANASAAFLSLVASVHETLGSPFAESTRRAADEAKAIVGTLNEIGATALSNAIAAESRAIEAGFAIVNMTDIFVQKSAEMRQTAESIMERSRAAQGAVLGGGAGAAGKEEQIGLTSAQRADAMRDVGALNKLPNPEDDYELISLRLLNDAKVAAMDEYYNTAAGKLELFNQSTLGMLISNAEMQAQVEANKNATIGTLMGDLVGMAIQQGGAMGKFAKAYHIAQTIWATSDAIMQVMSSKGPGWPMNLGVAAMIAAKGAMQIANIRKTNIGSAGGIVGISAGAVGGTPAGISDNVAGVTGAPLEREKVTQVVINGNVFSSQETADWIIEQIKSAVDSRDVVIISGNSRQALELVGA